MEIGLVSCTKQKREEPARPADLYDPSALFRKARAYCEQEHDEWLILSAKYGVLDPDGPAIEPYDETLTDAGVDRRREWAQQVKDELAKRGLLEPESTFVVHAGKAYYEELVPLLEDDGPTIELPVEGLGIGERLAWYNERI